MPATTNVGGFKMRHKDAHVFLVGSLPSIFGVASLQTRHKRLSFSAPCELDFEGLAVD